MEDGTLMGQYRASASSDDGSRPSSPSHDSRKVSHSRSPDGDAANRGSSTHGSRSMEKSERRARDRVKERSRKRSGESRPRSSERSRKLEKERPREKHRQSRRSRSRSPLKERLSPSKERKIRHRRSRSRSRERPIQNRRRRSLSPCRGLSKGKDRRSRSPIARKEKSGSPDKGRSPSKGKDCRSRSPDKRRRSQSPERHRSLSRGKDCRSRSPERRRSSSRGRDRRSRSRDRGRIYERSSRRRHSRDRFRRRSPDRRSPKRRMKEHLVQQAAKQTQEALELVSKLSQASSVAAEMEKPSILPLNNAPIGQITPQILLQQTMAVMNAKTQALTGVALPKYYNIAAVNPLKYAEQIQKRKLLWHGNKEKAATASIAENKDATTVHWEKATFAQDQDGKTTAKFRKLMGIKEDQSNETSKTQPQPASSENSTLNEQETLFRDLDIQYEVARMSTHTHRGVGLGYSSHATPIFPK